MKTRPDQKHPVGVLKNFDPTVYDLKDPLKNLACGVVVQAVKDYREYLKNGEMNFDRLYLEKFFADSEWIDVLEIDWNAVLKEIQEEFK